MDLECTTCSRRYKYDSRRGHTRTRCNSCCANTKYAPFKQRVVDHLGGKCCSCGYDRCIAALQVHHTDPSLKKFGVSTARHRPWHQVVEELRHCELLCANCHAERHFNAKAFFGSLIRSKSRLPERKVLWPNKARLEHLVNRLPMVEIGRRLHVSDNAVRKHCRKLGIEVPRRAPGYRAKIGNTMVR